MKKIPRTLHTPALQRTENNERVAAYVENFEDAPRASVTTRGKQREGRHLRPEFRGCSTRRHHNALETARRSPLTSRTSRTLHAPASRRAENNDRVTTYAQNFDDAPRASVTTLCGRFADVCARFADALQRVRVTFWTPGPQP